MLDAEVFQQRRGELLIARQLPLLPLAALRRDKSSLVRGVRPAGIVSEQTRRCVKWDCGEVWW